jgi:Histidinol-phosphate/aromatic aminotransferase and cobyric acid decarboxylase
MKARRSIEQSKLYPHLAHFKPGFTEKLNTLPYGGSYKDYPDPMQEQLRETYAQHLNALYNTSLTKENILFTAGCTEGIDLCIRTYCHPLEKVAYFKPCIPLFKDIAQKNDIVVESISLTGDYFSDIPPLPDIHKLVYICNPNNPLGIYYPQELIRNLAYGKNALIAVDETYIEFSKQPSSLSLLKDNQNIIILRSFSKGWGMAGVRAGVVIANPKIIDVLRKQQLPFSFSTPAQESISEGLNNYGLLKQNIERIIVERDKNYLKLQDSYYVDYIFPSFTNFLCIKLKDHCKFKSSLLNGGYFLTDFSAEVPNSIRFSIYKPEYNERFVRKFLSLI